MHKEEIEKVIQSQKDKMDADFEKKDHLTENIHREESNSLKKEHSREIEKLKNNYSQELTNLQT